MILIKCVLQQFAKVYKGFTMNVLLISNLNQFDPVLNTIKFHNCHVEERKTLLKLWFYNLNYFLIGGWKEKRKKMADEFSN
jgi:hypothetical protein